MAFKTQTRSWPGTLMLPFLLNDEGAAGCFSHPTLGMFAFEILKRPKGRPSWTNIDLVYGARTWRRSWPRAYSPRSIPRLCRQFHADIVRQQVEAAG